MTIEEVFIAAEKGGFETYLGPGTERFKVYDKSEIEIDLKLMFSIRFFCRPQARDWDGNNFNVENVSTN